LRRHSLLSISPSPSLVPPSAEKERGARPLKPTTPRARLPTRPWHRRPPWPRLRQVPAQPRRILPFSVVAGPAPSSASSTVTRSHLARASPPPSACNARAEPSSSRSPWCCDPITIPAGHRQVSPGRMESCTGKPSLKIPWTCAWCHLDRQVPSPWIIQVPRRPALSTTTFAMYIYTKTGPTSTRQRVYLYRRPRTTTSRVRLPSPRPRVPLLPTTVQRTCTSIYTASNSFRPECTLRRYKRRDDRRERMQVCMRWLQVSNVCRA